MAATSAVEGVAELPAACAGSIERRSRNGSGTYTVDRRIRHFCSHNSLGMSQRMAAYSRKCKLTIQAVLLAPRKRRLTYYTVLAGMGSCTTQVDTANVSDPRFGRWACGFGRRRTCTALATRIVAMKVSHAALSPVLSDSGKTVPHAHSQLRLAGGWPGQAIARRIQLVANSRVQPSVRERKSAGQWTQEAIHMPATRSACGLIKSSL